MEQVTEADIARSRADPRFRQELLTKSLEQLLGTLYRLQRGPASLDVTGMIELREGAMMAARLADMIRAIEDKMSTA